MTDSKTTAPETRPAPTRTADAWWSWHDADYSRHSATMEEAEERCRAWVDGEADEGPEDYRLANMIERGNGFPRVGDYVADEDGDLWEVVQAGSRITTDHPRGNVCHNYHVVPADWDDCAEGEDHSAAIEWPAD